jgi:methylenetetrahydrofolate reductase (NADPH)
VTRSRPDLDPRVSRTTPSCPGGLKDALAQRRFAITTEIATPASADPNALAHKTQALRGWVDAVNLTDSDGPQARMSSLGAAALVQCEGVSPVMELACRNRNRVALHSDLLAAGALNIPHVLLVTGDCPHGSDYREAKPVFDTDSAELIALARRLRDDRQPQVADASGASLRWMIGTVEDRFALPLSLRTERFAKKVAAGAEFAQTQCVFDLDVFAQWVMHLRDLGVPHRCAILAAVAPIRSLRMLEYLRNETSGVNVPLKVEQRLRSVPSDQIAGEGMRLCAEMIEQLTEIPGVAGVHVKAFGFEHDVPELLERAGHAPRNHDNVQPRGGQPLC